MARRSLRKKEDAIHYAAEYQSTGNSWLAEFLDSPAFLRVLGVRCRSPKDYQVYSGNQKNLWLLNIVCQCQGIQPRDQLQTGLVQVLLFLQINKRCYRVCILQA